jgi:hypothetical protein
MKLILDENCNFRLYENENLDLKLEVECGTTAVYDFTIMLEEEERDEFSKRGARFIKELADQIRDYPEDFQSRKV